MLLVMREGYLEAKVDGVTGRVGPGSVVYIAPDALQSVRNPAEIPATYFVFSVSSAAVPSS
jgi:mannose-6-phosphate isomerase-like protein (cupin superfamily)